MTYLLVQKRVFALSSEEIVDAVVSVVIYRVASHSAGSNDGVVVEGMIGFRIATWISPAPSRVRQVWLDKLVSESGGNHVFIEWPLLFYGLLEMIHPLVMKPLLPIVPELQGPMRGVVGESHYSVEDRKPHDCLPALLLEKQSIDNNIFQILLLDVDVDVARLMLLIRMFDYVHV